MTTYNNSRHYGNGNGNAPARQQGQAPAAQTFSSYLTGDGVKKRINEMIGGDAGQRFITSVISAVSTNPDLAVCDHGTILSAAMLGESLKLSPSPQLGQFYMVPYNDKKRGCKVAQFQLGYKGYIQLAIRSGQYKKLNVMAIKEGELIHFDPLNEDIEVELIQSEIEREHTPTIGYYAMFEYVNGFRKAIYWSKEKMEAHADKYSAAFKLGEYRRLMNGEIPQRDMWKYSSFWYKDFDGMAFKTMLRQLISKWGIMSIDMEQVFQKDMAVINENETIDYVDNPTYAEPVVDTTPEDEPQDNVQEIDTSNLLYELAQNLNVSADEDLELLENFVHETATSNNSDVVSVYQQALLPESLEEVAQLFASYCRAKAPVESPSTPQLSSMDEGLTVAQRRDAVKADIEAYGLDRKEIEQTAGSTVSSANSTQLANLVKVLANKVRATAN